MMIMEWILSVLKYLGIIPPFTSDEVMNAETEDALREHANLVTEVRERAAQRREGTAEIREALTQARTSVRVFGGFEQAIRHSQHAKKEHHPRAD